MVDMTAMIRKRLIAIANKWKGKNANIVFVTDGVVSNYYNERKHINTVVPVTAIISPVSDDKIWNSDGIFADGDLLMIVWDVQNAVKNYLTSEFFTESRIDDMFVVIGNTDYRVIDIIAPESIHNEIPYWVMVLDKTETQDL